MVSVRAHVTHVDASRICLRPDGANSECGRGLFGITKGRPIHSRWPSTKKHRLFLATTFPVPLNWQPPLRRRSPCSAVMQALFCQKTGADV